MIHRSGTAPATRNMSEDAVTFGKHDIVGGRRRPRSVGKS